MQKFHPLVSIIIPVYNGANYMREAIDSALAQTYEHKEILVINDGSTDGGETERIAISYGDKIRYIHKENGGVSTALNTGIQNMKGEYFSWLSHDDVYTPDKIEKQINALEKLENKTTLIGCRTMYIDKNSRPLHTTIRDGVHAVKLLTWQEALMQIQQKDMMNGCALLIAKEVFDMCGKFDERLRFNQDGFMWNKIFLKGYDLYQLPDICVKNRVHDKQLTQTGQNIFHKDCITMSHFLVPELVRVSTEENNFIVAYIKYNAKYGNRSVVKDACKKISGQGLLNLKDKCVIAAMSAYGIVRPMIRQIYYNFFKNIKTL